MAAKTTYTIEMQINGQDVEMNAFVQSFYVHTLLGSMNALKDVPEDIQNLTINIKRSKS